MFVQASTSVQENVRFVLGSVQMINGSLKRICMDSIWTEVAEKTKTKKNIIVFSDKEVWDLKTSNKPGELVTILERFVFIYRKVVI